MHHNGSNIVKIKEHVVSQPVSAAWLPAIPSLSAVGLCRTGNHTVFSLSLSLSISPSLPCTLPLSSPLPISFVIHASDPASVNRETFSTIFCLRESTDWILEWKT